MCFSLRFFRNGTEARAPKPLHVGRRSPRICATGGRRSRVEGLASGIENIVRLRAAETEDATDRPAGWRSPAASISRRRGMDGEARLLPGGPPSVDHRQLERKAMGTEVLERRFAAIGARLNVVGPPAGARRGSTSARTTRGEFFDVRFDGGGRPVELEVVDVDRADRHLLLLVRDGEREEQVPVRPRRAALVRRGDPGGRSRRHRRRDGEGRAAAGGRPRGGRPGAAEGSVPPPQRGLRPPGRVVLRPGAGARPPSAIVLRNEPLTRGHGKAHILEFAYRRGGEVVCVNRRTRAGSARTSSSGSAAQQRKRAGGAARSATPSCTRRARSGTPTTPRSCCPAGTAC